MLYALICTDRPGALEIRKSNRPAHLDWLKGLGAAVRLAGPFLTPEGKEPRGSLIIVEAKDIGAARKLAAADPYAKAGLFTDVDIRAWSWTVGKPEGV